VVHDWSRDLICGKTFAANGGLEKLVEPRLACRSIWELVEAG